MGASTVFFLLAGVVHVPFLAAVIPPLSSDGATRMAAEPVETKSIEASFTLETKMFTRQNNALLSILAQ